MGARRREGSCQKKFSPVSQALPLPTGLGSQGAASFQVGPQTQFSRGPPHTEMFYNCSCC